MRERGVTPLYSSGIPGMYGVSGANRTTLMNNLLHAKCLYSLTHTHTDDGARLGHFTKEGEQNQRIRRNDLYNEKWGHEEEGGTKSNLRQTISFVLLQYDKHNPTPVSQQGRCPGGWSGVARAPLIT